MKTVTYARYSSDQQREASIEDQQRLCRNYAKQHGFDIVDCYSDAAISGASMHRPGINQLMENAHRFDVVLCESLDRLSRDQSDIAFIYKSLKYYNVKIITIDDGETTSMHIGLKGTMGAMQLQQISDKTHRGLHGRVENGKSAGGKCYGYDVVKAFDGSGEPIKGEIEINHDEAAIVTRMFHDYAYKDKSAKTIATELNREGIISPSGHEWGCSTINGNRKRGTGILNNVLYTGKRVWNRLKYVKHPVTGKKVSRLNPESEWVISDVPEYRIIPKDLWEAVKAKQGAVSNRVSENKPRMRPRYLLSNLFKCESCGGGVSMVNSTQYGCSTSRNKGTCLNRKTVKRTAVEAAALDAIKSELLQEEIIEMVVKQYNLRIHELSRQNQTSAKSHRSVISKLEKEKANLLAVMKGGVKAKYIIEEFNDVSQKLDEAKLKRNEPPPKVLKNVGVAEKFKAYLESLEVDNVSQEAMVEMRNLVDTLILKSNGDADLLLNPYGLIKKKTRHLGESIPLVAGAGFEPTTFGL
jgi:site-specific DNA recombinase